ncbi:MAG TPA: cbb3-type cytochrome c oxidase subunit 3 [Casimicrobiaceae bacterium]|nr:cbb3-type cytochrome c oxidase subunit 3 [Casimicrobiaceae bacterium]
MEIYSMLASVLTVISFVLFIGIVLWAYSSHRKKAFEAAANAPFALDDDAPGPSKRELLP